MADANDLGYLRDQAQQAEQQEVQGAQRGLGSIAVSQEQQGYQQRIDATQPIHMSTPDMNTPISDTVKDVGNRVLGIVKGAEAGPIHAFGELEATVASHLGAGDYAEAIRQNLQHGVYDYATDAKGNDQAGAVGQVAQGITQFLTAFIPATRLLKGAAALTGISTSGRVATYAVNALGTASTMAAAFNPNNSRTSDLIQAVPALSNPLTHYLSTQPGDTEADGTMKNFLDGLVFSPVAEGAIDSLGAVFKGMRAANGVANTVKAFDAAKPTPVADVPQATTDGTGQPIVAHDVGAVGDHTFTAKDDKGNVNTTSAQETTYAGADALKIGRTDTVDADGNSVKGANLGIASYRAAADHALDNGMPLTSDVSVSPSAQKVWTKLEGEGYTVEKNEAEVNEETGNLVSKDGKPVFVASKKPPTPAPYEPPGLTAAETAQPKGTPTGTPEAPQFDPAAQAAKMIKITPENSKEVLGFITDGRYSEIPGVMEDTHRTIPWDTLSDGANLKGLFNAVESNFGDMIRAAHGTGAVDTGTIVQLAKDIGGDPAALSKLYGDTTANGGLAARITAGYNIMTASARRLKDLAANAHALNFETDAGKQAVLDFQKQLQLHAAIVGQVRQSSQEIGRALWAHRALKASSDVALQDINDIAGSNLGPGAIKKFMKQVGSGDLSSVNQAAANANGKGFLNVIKEVAQGGMLSSLGTQVRNLAGNAGNLLVKASERYLAGTIGQIRGVLMPGAETATIRSAIAHTAGMVDGVKDSFPLFVKALTTEQATSAAGRPLVRAIATPTEGLTGMKLTAAQIYNRVGQAIRYPGRLMGAIDNLNMGVGRQADQSARVYTQAATEADAKGLTGDARDAYLDKRIPDLKANLPADIKAKSVDAGLYQSFQEAHRTEVGGKIADALNSHPLVKLLVAPFVHRPMNMLRQTLVDYTPLAFANPEVRAALKSNSQDTDLAISRMTIGTAGLAYAYHLADHGYLTGPRMGYNNTQSLDGVQPNSLKVGERWFKFDSVDPVGMWLAIGAGLHEAIQRHYDPNDQDSVNQLAGLMRTGAQVMGQAAIDKSFMKSMDDVMSAFGEKDPNRMDMLMQRLVNENATKAIPFSGMLRSFAESLDPTRKDSSGPLTDQLKSNFPILSREVPDKLDLLGRPIQNPAGATAWFNPFGGAKASDDPLNQTLSSLALGIKPPPREIYGVTLDQKTHNEIVKMATQTPMFGGLKLEDALRSLTTSDLWHSYDHTDDNGVTAHSQMVQKYIDGAYDAAKKQFIATHQDFVDQHIKQLQQKAQHYQPVETPQ